MREVNDRVKVIDGSLKGETGTIRHVWPAYTAGDPVDAYGVHLDSDEPYETPLHFYHYEIEEVSA